MPNHCDSDLTVTGPSHDVREFMGRYVIKADGAVLSLDAILPEPAEFKELDRIAHEYEEQHPENPYSGRPKDGFNSGGYDWRIQNWGTKWGCYQTYGCETPIEQIAGGVVIHFSTAWLPFRTELLLMVSHQLPTLEFQYDSYECGAEYQMHVTVKGGEVLASTNSHYDGERGG